MQPQQKNPWDDFRPVGQPAARRPSPLMDYYWIVLGAIMAGALLGAAAYIGFEFWRHGNSAGTSRRDPLRRAAYAEVARGEVSFEDVKTRVGISAAIGGGVGLLLGAGYSLDCIRRERRPPSGS